MTCSDSRKRGAVPVARLAFDVQWWLRDDIPVRLDWWPGAEHYWYWHFCRLNITLLAVAGGLVVVIFFLTCLKRSGLEFTIRD